MKIVTIEEIQDRISQKFPNQNFEIVEYTRVSKRFGIKCLKCGKISYYSNFNNFINSKRLGVCQCYNIKNNHNKHLINLEKIKNILNNNQDIQFIEFWYKQDTKKYMIRVKCVKCNQIYSKSFADFMKNEKCPFCIGKELLNTQAVKSLLPDEYELLSEYKSTNDYVYIKHNCGFIWKTKAKKMYDYIGCPHCNKKKSKGEQKIIRFLLNNGYEFYNEYSFNWQTNSRRRYDFYIPDYNLIIEYNGEQHYKEIDYFKLSLTEQQQIDKEKKEDALKNNLNYLIIGYFDYKNIDTILYNWFNDYSERK